MYFVTTQCQGPVQHAREDRDARVLGREEHQRRGARRARPGPARGDLQAVAARAININFGGELSSYQVMRKQKLVAAVLKHKTVCRQPGKVVKYIGSRVLQFKY